MIDIDKWNQSQLKRRGINKSAPAPKAVRAVGDAKRAVLWDGTIVERTEYIWSDMHGQAVKCCPYELHFIYKTPSHIKGYELMCTCGSIAGVVGYAAYSKLASPTSTGLMIVCIRHASTRNNVGIGEHADLSHE